MNTIKLNTTGPNVKMIAHRGLSGLEAENTCAAFVAAGNREKYFGIECDIHRTLDGKFVIFHDDNTKRMAKDSMIIEETTFDTLRSLRLGEPRNDLYHRADLVMPTLEEYIACSNAGVGTFIGMHAKPEIVEGLKKHNKSNLIIAGHMASDSVGFNQILKAWEEKGIEVVRISGIV